MPKLGKGKSKISEIIFIIKPLNYLQIWKLMTNLTGLFANERGTNL
jgi:hypothetical protein